MNPRILSGLFLAGLAGSLVVGCTRTDNNPPAPPLFPAKGIVVDKNGKPYTSGGEIRFGNPAKPELTTNGAIDPEGRFSLGTIVGNKRLDGATEGEFKVTITGQSKDQSQPPVSYDLKKKYALKAGQAEITVVLE